MALYYLIVFLEPYEFDYDESFGGDGQHHVDYSIQEQKFEAKSDKEALRKVRKLMKEKQLLFQEKPYPAIPIELRKIDKKVVKSWIKKGS